ncbi:MAG: hypothetical protein AB7P69_03755 [Candidatus Binatia bacterium]
MRGRKPTTELMEMDQGLKNAEDPYLIKDLLARDVEELADEVRKEILYSVIAMVRAGRYFMAIKKQLGHGEWEQFVLDHGWSFHYVRGCLKLLEVVAKFPQALHLPGGRVTDRLLYLPMPKIEQVLDQLPPQAVKQLTPWDLQKIYDEKKTRKEAVPKGLPEVEVTALDSLVAALTSNLRMLADLTIPKTDYARAKRYADELADIWDRCSWNLVDPGHTGRPPWELGNTDDITEKEDEG